MIKKYTLNNLIQLSQKIKLSSKKIVFLGDSITQERAGFVNIIRQIFFEILHLNKIEIINAGIGGDTTANVLKRIKKDVISQFPDKVFIMLGVNDSYFIHHSLKVQAVFLNHYSQNLINICKIIKKETKAEIILMTPTIVIGNLVEYSNWEKELVKYAQEVRKIAKNEKLKLIDIFASFEKYKNKIELFENDGFHPNLLGHRILVYEVLSFLSLNC